MNDKQERPMTVGERLRANLDMALAYHRTCGGDHLTITSLAERAGMQRQSLAGLGGHTKLNTLRRITGPLRRCTVSDLVAGIEPILPISIVMDGKETP